VNEQTKSMSSRRTPLIHHVGAPILGARPSKLGGIDEMRSLSLSEENIDAKRRHINVKDDKQKNKKPYMRAYVEPPKDRQALHRLGTVDYENKSSFRPKDRIHVFKADDSEDVDESDESSQDHADDKVSPELLFSDYTLGIVASDVSKIYNGYCEFEKIMRQPRSSGKYVKRPNKTITRSLNLPSEVSENLARFALYKYEEDSPSGFEYFQTSFFCKRGDLAVEDRTQIEVKGFTSDGPLSYGPTEHWDKLVFVNMRNHIETGCVQIILVNIADLDTSWKNIYVKKEASLSDHSLATKKIKDEYIEKSILNKYDETHLTASPTNKSFRKIVSRILKRKNASYSENILLDFKLYDLKFLMEFRNIDVPVKSGSNKAAKEKDIEIYSEIILNTPMQQAQSTFEDQCLQKRRPRISFNNTYDQLKHTDADKFLVIWDGPVNNLLDPSIPFEPIIYDP